MDVLVLESILRVLRLLFGAYCRFVLARNSPALCPKDTLQPQFNQLSSTKANKHFINVQLVQFSKPLPSFQMKRVDGKCCHGMTFAHGQCHLILQ